MKVLVVRNSETAPEGAFGDWIVAQGHAMTVLPPDAADEAAMDAAEVVVVLGSPHGVYDTHIPWIPRQTALVARRLAQRRPYVGICFGAQQMAQAAGGASAAMADGRSFRGWFGIGAAADPVLAGPWPRWHGDHITPPPGAEVLAHDAGTVQALALPRAVGVQFHPEATPEIIRGWAERFAARHGPVDIPALEAESARHYPARKAAREALFAWLLRRATEG